MACPPPGLKVQLRLEVEPEYELTDAATGIIRSRSILVGSRHAAEGRGPQTAESVYVIGSRAHEEVDVVKGVQHFNAHFHVDVLREANLLCYAEIKTGEARSMQHQI